MRQAVVIGIIALMTLTARFATSTNSEVRLYTKSKEPTIVDGVIDVLPEMKDNWQVFTVASTDGERIKVYADRFHEYHYNDAVKMAGSVSLPRNFRSESGREFDYVNFLLKDGICCEMKNPEITVTIPDDASSLKSKLFRFRGLFVENIKSTMGEPHSSLAGGLVIGSKSSLGNDLLDKFRAVGLVHIIVLSGYNITIVADTMRRLLGFLPRRVGLTIGILAISLFGILVGGGATVVRSCIMATLGTTALLFRRQYDASRALFIAGYIMVMENPQILLHDPSFQLSFLATLGLILFSKPIERWATFITEKFGIRSLFATTFATQIAVAPFILFSMGTISIIGFLVNIFVLPFIPITMLLVTATGLLGFFWHTGAVLFGWMSYILLEYELLSVDLASKVPFASIEVPRFSVWMVVSIYVVYAVVVFYGHLRRKNTIGNTVI